MREIKTKKIKNKKVEESGRGEEREADGVTGPSGRRLNKKWTKNADENLIKRTKNYREIRGERRGEGMMNRKVKPNENWNKVT